MFWALSVLCAATDLSDNMQARFKAKEDRSVKEGVSKRWGIWDNKFIRFFDDKRYKEDKAWEKAYKLNDLYRW